MSDLPAPGLPASAGVDQPSADAAEAWARNLAAWTPRWSPPTHLAMVAIVLFAIGLVTALSMLSLLGSLATAEGDHYWSMGVGIFLVGLGFDERTVILPMFVLGVASVVAAPMYISGRARWPMVATLLAWAVAAPVAGVTRGIEAQNAAVFLVAAGAFLHDIVYGSPLPSRERASRVDAMPEGEPSAVHATADQA